MSDVAIVGPGGVRATLHDDGSITYPAGAGPTGRRAESGMPPLPPSMRKGDDELGIEDKDQFPMPGYGNVPVEHGLEHEDPIGNVIVGGAASKPISSGLSTLLEMAGTKLGQAGASATTRIATRAVEDEAARLAANEAPAAAESPIRRLANIAGKAVDTHNPLKPIMNGVASVAERPVDRMLASPAIARLSAAAQSGFPGMRPTGGLMYLLGHDAVTNAVSKVPPPSLLLDLATAGGTK